MEKLKKIVNDIRKNRDEEEITTIHDGMHLRNDLGFDSMDLAELTVKIEAEYDVDIFESGIVTTIKEVIEKIEQNEKNVLQRS